MVVVLLCSGSVSFLYGMVFWVWSAVSSRLFSNQKFFLFFLYKLFFFIMDPVDGGAKGRPGGGVFVL